MVTIKSPKRTGLIERSVIQEVVKTAPPRRKRAEKYSVPATHICRWCGDVAPKDIPGDNEGWKCGCGELSIIYHSSSWDIP